jgi:hypothetical protein
MAASAALELQGAIVAKLKADNIAGGRVYDTVPGGALFPYVSLGPGDSIEIDHDCIEAEEITVQIDAWSRAQGYPEVLGIAAQIRESLHNYDATLSTNAFVSLLHRNTRRMRDPDGLTSHAVVEFVAVVELV